jgi:murein DD-endopeptidase MepM/ murein hydrolase activator NlpD
MRRNRRHESALVLTATATALYVAVLVPVAGAIGVEEVTEPVEQVIDETVTDPTTMAAPTSSTTTSTSTTSTTLGTATTAPSTTSTTSTTTSTTTPGVAGPRTATEQPASPPPTSPEPTDGGAGRAGDAPVADALALPSAAAGVLAAVDLPARFGEPTEVPARPILAGPRSTAGLFETLRGISATPDLVASVLAPFPVAGPAQYTDDWHAPRHGGRLHKGVDIFAQRGTPVLAAADGVIGSMTTTAPLGGTSLRLTATGGTAFYYAHLDRFAPGLTDGDRVRAGQVVGFVGNTGNAITTPPHLHFQVHPAGGPPVPPVPYLDRWLSEAAVRLAAITGSPAVDAVLRPLPLPAERSPSTWRTEPSPEPHPASAEREAAGQVDPLAAVFVVVPAWWAFRRWRKRRLALVRVGP